MDWCEDLIAGIALTKYFQSISKQKLGAYLLKQVARGKVKVTDDLGLCFGQRLTWGEDKMIYEKPRLVVIAGKDVEWARGVTCSTGSNAADGCNQGNTATGTCQKGPSATGSCRAGAGT